MKLTAGEKLDLRAILQDLQHYPPKRKGWSWRRKLDNHRVGPFVYKNASAYIKQSVPLLSARCFGDIDPQCDCVITTEIASGRFEDDLRRMRMAAWHGADHIMVIRTTGR